MSTFFYVPQYFTTQLSVAGGIDDSQTTGIVLQSISGVDETLPGIIAFSWSNPIDTTKVEYITYTSINATTKELQGVTRGQEGYSAKSHLNGATVAWPLSKSHINNIPDSTTTFTNKRINPRVVTAASYTTDTGTALDVSTCDEFDVTAQAGDLKLNNPGGTPVNGQKLIVRIKDNGTAIALTYDTQFRSLNGITLPTTTVISETLYMEFIYNSADTKWDIVRKTEPVSSALSSKVISFTRDGTAASGNVSYTGVGFKPTSIYALMIINGALFNSDGFSDSAKSAYCRYQSGANVNYIGDALIQYSNQTDWAQTGNINSYDDDGFTITWTKIGSPQANTMICKLICYK